jgi:hypothetical protein
VAFFVSPSKSFAILCTPVFVVTVENSPSPEQQRNPQTGPAAPKNP